MKQIKHKSTGEVLVEIERDSLKGAGLSCAELEGADLRGENLQGASLRGADLTGADLTGANLTRADLTEAGLTEANLTGADLSWADLTHADLTGADLTGADLTETIFPNPRTEKRTPRDVYGAIDEDVEEVVKAILGNGCTEIQDNSQKFGIRWEAQKKWEHLRHPPGQPQWPTKKDIECCGVWVYCEAGIQNVMHIDKTRLNMFGSYELFEKWKRTFKAKKIEPMPNQCLVETTSVQPSQTERLKREAMKKYPPGSTWNNKKQVKSGGWFDEFPEKPMSVEKCVKKYPRVTDED